MKKTKANFTDTYLEVGELKVPLRIYIERRSTIRISLGKDNVLMRIPIFEGSRIQHHIEQARLWLYDIYNANPKLIEKYHVQRYTNSKDLIILGKDRYEILVEDVEFEKGSITLKQGIIKIQLPAILDPFDKRILIRNILSKVLIKRYKKFVEERIQYWNDRYFQKEISGVLIRYNSTNWGSCSSNKKINISTRSLLLPMEVFDYILVHELSHLVEMNHSSRFWNVVKQVMPNYEEAEDWIKNNGSGLDF